MNWKTTRNWLSNGGAKGTRETSVTTNIPENESIQFTLGDNHQLLDEADHDVKNCTDRGYCYPSAKLDKSPQALHTSSHFRMIVLLSYLGHRLSFKTLAFFSARFQDTHDIQSTLDNSKQSRFPLDFLRTLAWISAITSRVVFTPSAKQPCQFFVFTFFSLQLKFSVHSCILCCLIAFPPHLFAYFRLYSLLQTPDNSNSP